MSASSITFSSGRERRSTAGINKRYDETEYLLVSFPHLQKHGIVSCNSVDRDPLDKQNGSIKTFGTRKNFRIIGEGTKEAMKEKASRYASSAGSEEIELMPESKENCSNRSDEDDDYSPPRTARKSIEVGKERNSFNDNSYQQQQSSEDQHNRSMKELNLDFDRIYSTQTTKRKDRTKSQDESSLSGSDVALDEDDSRSAKTKKNTDSSSILNKKRRKKKTDPSKIDENGPCTGCIKHQQNIVEIQKRLERLEKIFPLIKKFRVKSCTGTNKEANFSTDDNEIYKRIKDVCGVHPGEIKSTPSRPTMVMRELIKKAGRIGDRQFFKQHEEVFKEFIQMKCLIHDDNLEPIWKEILDSINRQHIDEASNKKKKMRQDISPSATTSTGQSETETSNGDSPQMSVSDKQ